MPTKVLDDTPLTQKAPTSWNSENTDFNANMASEKAAETAQVPSPHVDVADAKEVKVLSVELADAVAKDKPNYKSRIQITMYLIMLFNTLSE